MSDPRISRRNFIRGAAVGAAAFSGLAAAGDYSPPDVIPPGANPNIIAHPDKIIVYPTGNQDWDFQSLQSAFSEYTQKKIILMDRTIGGIPKDFVLGDGYAVEVTRDASLIGYGNGSKILGGYAAFMDDGILHNLSIQKIFFQGQSTAAVLGNFNKIDIVSSGVNPDPVPYPACGFVIACNGSINLVNNTIQHTWLGIFVGGAPQGGRINSQRIISDECGIYLSGATTYFFNSLLYLDISGNHIACSNGALSNIILNGGAIGNKITGNKFLGNSLIANVFIGTDASDTMVRTGAGSVSGGVNPEPVPKPLIIDLGLNSDIKGNFIMHNSISPEDMERIISMEYIIQGLFNIE